MALSEQDVNKLNEAVGILMGWRPLKGDKPGKAVTAKELKQLQDVVNRIDRILKGKAVTLTSAQVTAAPTAADFNKLQTDVKAINALISGLISSSGS